MLKNSGISLQKNCNKEINVSSTISGSFYTKTIWYFTKLCLFADIRRRVPVMKHNVDRKKNQ